MIGFTALELFQIAKCVRKLVLVPGNVYFNFERQQLAEVGLIQTERPDVLLVRIVQLASLRLSAIQLTTTT